MGIGFAIVYSTVHCFVRAGGERMQRLARA